MIQQHRIPQLLRRLASGAAGEDDEEEMDEESSEDVCTNLLTSVMNNIPYFLTLRRVP
jgi:hypothetical protein